MAQPDLSTLTTVLSALAGSATDTNAFFQTILDQQRVTTAYGETLAAETLCSGGALGGLTSTQWTAFKAWLEDGVSTGDLYKTIQFAQERYLLSGNQDAAHLLEQRRFMLALAVLWKYVRATYPTLLTPTNWYLRDNTVTGAPANGNSFTVAYPNTVVSGNLMLLCVVGSLASGNVSSITDTVGSTWTVRKVVRVGDVFVDVWGANAAASGANTLDVTLNGSATSIAYMAHEVGVPSAVYGGIGLNENSGTAATGANGAETGYDFFGFERPDNCLALAFFVDISGSQATITPGTLPSAAMQTGPNYKAHGWTIFSEWLTFPVPGSGTKVYANFSAANAYVGILCQCQP